MVKKLLSSLATLTLVVGSVTSTTAWTEYKNQNNENIKNQNNQSSQDYSLNKNQWSYFKRLGFLRDASVVYAYDDVIYVSGGPFYDNGILYESVDNGVTWNQNKSLLSGLAISNFFGYNNIVYVASSNGGFWESFDNGKTFTQNKSLTGNIFNSVYAYNNVIYVTGYYGFWESFDNGKTFTQNKSIPNDSLRTYYFNKVVYIETDGNGFWESFDNGKTFMQNSSIPNNNEETEVYGYDTNANIIYVVTYNGGLWESFDNGKTFTQNKSLPTVSKIYGAVYAGYIYAGTDSGLYESEDGGKNWDLIFNPPGQIDNVYVYSNYGYAHYIVYVETSGSGEGYGMSFYESTDNGRTFNEKKLTQNNSDTIEDLFTYNKATYIATDNGLYEQKPYATVTYPNKIIDNYNDLLYANPINFSFDWTLLSQVTITDNSSKTPKTKTLTSGNYQIKNDGNYTVIFHLKNGDVSNIKENPLQETFVLKTGYDFSQGINAATWDPTTSYLNIYLNEAIANNIKTVDTKSQRPIALLLSYISNIYGTTSWNDILSNKTLENWFNDAVGSNIFNNLDVSLVEPQKGGSLVNWSNALSNKIKNLNPQKGLMFHIHENNGKWDNLPNPITPPSEPNYLTNYWDEVLFNQN